MTYLFFNIFSCIVEVALLKYFYMKLLKEPIKGKRLEFYIYLFITIYLLYISCSSIEPKIRSICTIIPFLLPILLYPQHLRLKFAYGIIYWAIQVMSESLTKAVALSNVTLPFAINYGQGVLISKSLAFILILFFISSIRVYNIKFPRYLTLILLFIPVSSVLAIYKVREFVYLLNQPSIYFEYLLVVTLLFALNIVLFFLFEKNTELHWLKTQMLLQNALLEEQKNYYANVTHIYEQSRRLNHDLKNHFLILQGYIQASQIDAALSHIQSLVTTVKENSIIHSGSTAIDAILTAKQSQAREQATKFDLAKLNFPVELLCAEQTLSIILGNLLDNALEATIRIPESTKRWIQILLHHDDIYLYLRIMNSTIKDIAVTGNILPTQKMHKEHHGFGLSSSDILVSTLHGIMQLTSENLIFTVDIMIPLHQE